MDIRTKIHDYVRSLLAEQGITTDPGPNDPLVGSGLLDSLSVVQTVVFMEKEFGVDFSDIYFDQDIFNTINEMVAFVREHRKTV